MKSSPEPSATPTGDAPEASFKPEPPALIKWIAWFFKNWRSNWLYVLVALLLVIGAVAFEALNLASELIDWIACMNPDQMKRPLRCWSR